MSFSCGPDSVRAKPCKLSSSSLKKNDERRDLSPPSECEAARPSSSSPGPRNELSAKAMVVESAEFKATTCWDPTAAAAMAADAEGVAEAKGTCVRVFYGMIKANTASGGVVVDNLPLLA
eukprot:m.77745 g.77745  ORF g.77745 m.77745 type:complete len:120 (-) comp14559_c0_seq1:145-504(-)